MNTTKKHHETIPIEDLSFDEFDETNTPHPQPTDFDNVVEAALSRRDFLGGVIGFGVANFIMTASAFAKNSQNIFNFKAVPTNTFDTITLPEGFEWYVVAKWGDPLWSDTPDLDEQTGGTAKSQNKAFGDNNDGMSLFEQNGKHILVVNNEYINKRYLFPTQKKHRPQSANDALKSKAAHGLSIVEVKQDEKDQWAIVKDSPLNQARDS